MKKKIIGGFVVAAIAALATFNINVNMSTHNGLSAVSLANVEALASGESGGGNTCYHTITSKPGSMVMYCGTCTWVLGTNSWISGTSTC